MYKRRIETCENAIPIMNSLVVAFCLVSSIFAAPVGPDFNNIQYAHNLSLTYRDGSLHGMDQINSLPDVDSQMAESLKEAINRAYSSTPIDSTTMPPILADEPQTGAPLNLETSSDHVRFRRDASPSTMSPISDTPTTQPYGTDEEFYARTDLIHFHVDIDTEGSGASMDEATSVHP